MNATNCVQSSGIRAEPTLNALNASNNLQFDLNQNFDNFVQNIRLASNGEVNWNLNDIDTSDFQELIVNMKSGEKNNWNMSSDQFVNFASSLSNILTQSIKLSTSNGGDSSMMTSQQRANYENNIRILKTELANLNSSLPKDQYTESSVNLNLNDSQLKLPMDIINNLCMSHSNANMNNRVIIIFQMW